MINQDSQFRLQAYLDGELPSRDSAEVRDWVARDREALALLEELRMTNTVLAGHEAECKLPESRDFFWSKIEREIERREREAVPASAGNWYGWLRRHVMPVSGVALVACLCGMAALHSGKGSGQFGEMELATDDMGSYTFRDQEQKMTMVWLYDRTDDSQTADAGSSGNVEME